MGFRAVPVPSGVITIWSGSIAAIPAGWALCDGQNNTPDLRDKFVVGALQDEGGVAKSGVAGALAQSGGTSNHSHTGYTEYGGDGLASGSDVAAGTDFSKDLWGHDHQLDAAVNNSYHIPPFFALAYIMKL